MHSFKLYDDICSRTTELRRIPTDHKIHLSNILDQNDAWQTLMEIIPKNLPDIHRKGIKLATMPRKYTAEQIRFISVDSERRRSADQPFAQSSPTLILFEEWATSGRKRPTLHDFQQLLIRSKLFRAADYVAVAILNEEAPRRPQGPYSKVPISFADDECESPNATIRPNRMQGKKIQANLVPDTPKPHKINKAKKTYADPFHLDSSVVKPFMADPFDLDSIQMDRIQSNALPDSDILTDAPLCPDLTDLLPTGGYTPTPDNLNESMDSNDSHYIPKFTYSFS